MRAISAAWCVQQRAHELKGRRLDAKAAVPKAHLGTAKLTKKMFVGGTGDLIDQDLKDHFGQYGDIEDVAVSRFSTYHVLPVMLAAFAVQLCLWQPSQCS
jgi:hypothetical protein